MNKSGNATASWRDVWQSGLFSRLVLLCFGVWLHAGNSLMVATIIPAVLADIGGAAIVA